MKGITFKHGLNRGINLSPSEINMWNSILQSLLTRILDDNYNTTVG